MSLRLSSKILDDYDFRRAMAKTFKGFCLIYLSHHFSLPPGIYHDELMGLLSNPNERFLSILGFRGCSKSTLSSLALPLWAALEHPDYYPFILPIADTGMQAGINIANIKDELDHNSLIKQDYGNINGEFVEAWDLKSDEEWQAKNMLLSNGVRILARSRGQKVRGLKHYQHRPKLVIADDVEDYDWTRKKENRDKTERWLLGEVKLGIDTKVGRIIVIGNKLHQDALMMRLSNNPNFKNIEIPIMAEKDGKNIFYWPAMFPDEKSLEFLKATPAEAIIFQREYMLKAVSEDGQPIKQEWIQYYDTKPKEAADGMMGTGVDLAISKKETADYTTFVDGVRFYVNDVPKIYIESSPINERLTFHETIQLARSKKATRQGAVFYVEDVAYQKAAIQEMERKLIPVVPMKRTTDKHAMLLSIAPYIQNGTVVFPRTGCEDLILQMLGWGTESHDDLVDALINLVLGLVSVPEPGADWG